MLRTDLLTVVHLLASAAMTGLIWFVQVVHYPLMQQVGATGGKVGFVEYERAHVHRTGLVVGPIMLLEAATAAALPFVLASGARGPSPLRASRMLAIVWASTWGLQVPCHRRLETGFDPVVVDRLVQTNWIRTIAWTGRAFIAAAIIIVVRGTGATSQ